MRTVRLVNLLFFKTFKLLLKGISGSLLIILSLKIKQILFGGFFSFNVEQGKF